jgi:hypothetical protein
MAWAQSFRPTPTQQARADLARELDVALHGHATFEGHVTESRWLGFLDEVRGLAGGSSATQRERLARVRQGLG